MDPVYINIIFGVICAVLAFAIKQVEKRIDRIEKDAELSRTTAATERKESQAETRAAIHELSLKIDTIKDSLADIRESVAGFNGVYVTRRECAEKQCERN